MKRLIFSPFVLWFLLSVNAYADLTGDAETVFFWGESRYPEFFFPPQAPTQVAGSWIYRYYGDTGTYLGISPDGGIYVVGAVFRADLQQPLFISRVADMLASVNAAGGRDALLKVLLKTNLGDIVLQLFPQQAPLSSANFLRYVKEGFYDGLVFHRVIPGFMAQGGGLDLSLTLKATRTPIQNEAANGLKNIRGSLAMARRSEPHSATSQFFINYVDNAFLDYISPDSNWGYAVFGQVLEGMQTVDNMEKIPTGTFGAYRDVPALPIQIESARLVGG